MGWSGSGMAAPRRGGARRGSSGAAVVFCGVGARREQESEGNGSLGSLRCSCARWKRAAGSAGGAPRRRRGGGRRGGSGRGGAAWRGVEAPARGNRRGRRSGATRGGQRDGKRWPGSLSTAPASVPSVGGGETEQGVVVEEKDDFEISKNSRDYSVNQR